MIDFRSDTVTCPSKEMRQFMFDAPLGDDVFGEDPTINKLQEKLADLFGFEAGLFCASGTMCNQLAIKTHCKSGDEIIASSLSHIYLYEGGGTAANSGVSMKMIEGDYGRLKAADVKSMINPDDAHFPNTSLVCLEDSMNKGGGACYDFEDIKAISALCKSEGLKLHLDGARVFNSLMHSGINMKEYGSQFDSISICLSKGLGCPVGSVLLGSKEFIYQAHRYRKTFGGGMRQAGVLAAAGIWALDNNIQRLVKDHKKAASISEELKKKSFVEFVYPTTTNIVVFQLKDGLSSDSMVKLFEEHGLLIVPFGPDKARIVTHLDISEEDYQTSLKVISNMDV